MNEVVKLGDVVTIRAGMVVAKTSNTDESKLTDAYVRMIGTSDFDEDLVLRDTLEPNVLYKDTIGKNFLQVNEILFNAKGHRFFAYLFKGEYTHTIASGVFMVLTLKSEKVTPAYLEWYLNHPETLKVFKSKKTSQTIPSITKLELSELEVIIPDLDTQHRIIELDQLKKKRIRVQRELVKLHEAYINAVTYKKIKDGN